MAVALALGGALIYGCADFCGGLATRRSGVTAVVLLGQCAGLLVLLPALALVAGTLDGVSMAWGAAAGTVGAVGLLLFYRGLAVGPMAVVAPLTAVTAAAVPVAAGVAFGERPSPLALVGVAGAVVAVALISAEGGRFPARRQLLSSGTLTALGAGLAFGLLFVFLSRSGDDSGMWPLVGARAASILLLAGVIVALRGPARVERASAPLTLLAGLGDMAANVLFVLAAREGLLSITGVLFALYPAATVLLAVVVLRERLAGVQVVGLGVAMAAVTAIALS